MSLHLSRMAGLAVACVVFCSASSVTNARVLKEGAPMRNLDDSQSISPARFDVCQNPFMFREAEKTNVLKALLGEAVNPLQIAGAECPCKRL